MMVGEVMIGHLGMAGQAKMAGQAEMADGQRLDTVTSSQPEGRMSSRLDIAAVEVGFVVPGKMELQVEE